MWKKAIDKSLNKAAKTVKPVAIGKFSGRVDKKFPRFFGWMFGIKRDLPLDLVDYNQADEFVKKIKESL